MNDREYEFSEYESLMKKREEWERLMQLQEKAENSSQRAAIKLERSEAKAEAAEANFWEEAEVIFGLDSGKHEYGVVGGTIFEDPPEEWSEEDEGNED